MQDVLQIWSKCCICLQRSAFYWVDVRAGAESVLALWPASCERNTCELQLQLYDVPPFRCLSTRRCNWILFKLSWWLVFHLIFLERGCRHRSVVSLCRLRDFFFLFLETEGKITPSKPNCICDLTVTKIPKFRNVTKEDSTRAHETSLSKGFKNSKMKNYDSFLTRVYLVLSNAYKEQNLTKVTSQERERQGCPSRPLAI